MRATAVRRRKGQRGFTLVEVMITMFLMTFIVQGLAMVSLYARRSGIHARRLTSANILAEQTLEQYRNTDYTNLPTLHGVQVCYDVHMATVACGSASAFFTKTTSITADTPIANVSSKARRGSSPLAEPRANTFTTRSTRSRPTACNTRGAPRLLPIALETVAQNTPAATSQPQPRAAFCTNSRYGRAISWSCGASPAQTSICRT